MVGLHHAKLSKYEELGKPKLQLSIYGPILIDFSSTTFTFHGFSENEEQQS